MTDRSVDINFVREKGERMSPKLIDKEQRKKEIALVALDLFAEKGLDATSISEVARLAGIGKGTVYEYFSSKEDLILAAFMAWMEQMMETEIAETLFRIEDAEERFRTAIQVMMEPFMSDERAIKITLLLFQIMLKDDTLIQNPQTQRLFQGMRKLLSDLLLEGVAQGAFKPEIAREVDKITINLFAYLDGIAAHYYINRNDFNMMDQVNFYLDRLLKDLRVSE
jgi:AcrR family transcriptional regulator